MGCCVPDMMGLPSIICAVLTWSYLFGIIISLVAGYLRSKNCFLFFFFQSTSLPLIYLSIYSRLYLLPSLGMLSVDEQALSFVVCQIVIGCKGVTQLALTPSDSILAILPDE